MSCVYCHLPNQLIQDNLSCADPRLRASLVCSHLQWFASPNRWQCCADFKSAPRWTHSKTHFLAVERNWQRAGEDVAKQSTNLPARRPETRIYYYSYRFPLSKTLRTYSFGARIDYNICEGATLWSYIILVIKEQSESDKKTWPRQPVRDLRTNISSMKNLESKHFSLFGVSAWHVAYVLFWGDVWFLLVYAKLWEPGSSAVCQCEYNTANVSLGS